MTLAFVLTMPGNNSWNGKWSGEGNCYALLRTVRNTIKAREQAAEIADRHYGYSFGDGWYANVEVKQVDAKEAKELRKRSRGFMGYDWMVGSIYEHGEIRLSARGAQ